MLKSLLVKRYKTIVIDPPWEVKRGPDWGSNGKSRILVYPTMSIDRIAKLPVKTLSEGDCHLYLWTINKYIKEAYSLVREWGFTPSTLLIWAKTPNGIGLGGTYSLSSEFCLFARKGTLTAKKRHSTNWWQWKRGKHSQKPEEFQDIVEETSPGPYLEMFARRRRPGWDVWGNEVESDIDLVA